MAKGLRSNVRKDNKAKLRAAVFGPMMDARTQRLSLKLQQLSSIQLPGDANMADIEPNISRNQNEVRIRDMKSGNCDVDISEQRIDTKQGSDALKSNNANPIHKRTRRKKRSSIIFAPTTGKARRIKQRR